MIMATPTIIDVRFEHYRPSNLLGIHELRPRISWRFEHTPQNFQQIEYEIELRAQRPNGQELATSVKVESAESSLVAWPHSENLVSRGRYSVRVQAKGKSDEGVITIGWSQTAELEAGLLQREDWHCRRISSPWGSNSKKGPQPEDLFRKEFRTAGHVKSARLYMTAEGVYEAELNGKKIGDHFLAPGWTTYNNRIQYQTYDVTPIISGSHNCLGVRVGEGWCVGRMGFEGGRRALWADQTSIWGQLEIQYQDCTTQIITTDESWVVTQGPTRLGEIYDGEKYDARLEVEDWSLPGTDLDQWTQVTVLEPFPKTTDLTSGFSEPVRRIETLSAVQTITTPSGKTILDFGQNLVGYVRLKKVKGERGHSVTLAHAEVLEKDELGTRPLRICKAQDIYTLKGDVEESYEPRFTFHGFRYVQVDDWPSSTRSLGESIEAVVCNTDMERAGFFSCSNKMVTQLFSNVHWSMRGNFLAVPTDCPQRDERLGWTGDLALFAPTAAYMYKCAGILKNWLVDVEFEQNVQGGIPALVTPNVLHGDEIWGKIFPLAIWHDVTILAPWALWEATGDSDILERQFDSIATWLRQIPRNKDSSTHLWDLGMFQLADWLDPNAPPDQPQKALTDPLLVANAFLVRCLALVAQIAERIGRTDEAIYYEDQAAKAKEEFQLEYVAPNGRIVSESQTAYALAICFDILSASQMAKAGSRLSEIVRNNQFKIGTGFAGTPYVCEALARTGHGDVAYAMLLNETCPSWLYPITKGATTTWERWDSLLPDGSINPGEMTSFNHYAFGAVATFLTERLAGLRCLLPGWKKSRFEPDYEGPFDWAKTEHLTPYGKVAASWTAKDIGDGVIDVEILVTVPPTTSMEVIIPAGSGSEMRVVGSGDWSLKGQYKKEKEWPVPLPNNLPF